MGVLSGDLLVLDVESTTPGTFIPVNDLTRYAANTTQERTTYGVFQGVPKVTYGQHVKTLALAGLLNPSDTGQQRLRSAHATKSPIKVRALPDGINGFEATVRVLAMTHEATPEQEGTPTLQPCTIDCEVVGEPTTIGSGIIA